MIRASGGPIASAASVGGRLEKQARIPVGAYIVLEDTMRQSAVEIGRQPGKPEPGGGLHI